MNRLLCAFAVLTLALSLRRVAPARAEEALVPPAVYPALARSGSDAESFAPKGWTVEAVAKGDLDRDGRSDLAFVLHEQDKAKILPISTTTPDQTWDSNPRILAIAFARPDGGYRLVVQNHSLIPRRESANLDDAFEDPQSLAIVRGAISVKLHLFASTGGADTGYKTFIFRHHTQSFVLIGYDASNVQRMSGETRETSVNYLTGRATVATGTISDDATRRRSRTLPPGALLTFEDVGDGLEFDPFAERR
ncbi:hypothetical protein [Methylobacterium trifolii]|uniref:VCBS repeat-containing protein n=1 Tax=Methylobacterium trifolii TaxID=1003092 RepID=A0ABQ4TXS0_9HYPH|nr:hypothetical protein [Methylobacterium trifolii]GJE58837.1 hypothetical protein MPOCJGCO_0922 [Methylobacterium trifolii]